MIFKMFFPKNLYLFPIHTIVSENLGNGLPPLAKCFGTEH